MPDDMKNFYTLNEVRKLLAEKNDRAFNNDEAIMRLINTSQLIPYLKYTGSVYLVTHATPMNRESTISSLTNTIKKDISKLEIGDLTSSLSYDSTTKLNDIIYYVKKLLSSFQDQYAIKVVGSPLHTSGLFKLSPLNISHSQLGIELVFGKERPISKGVEFYLNDQELSDDEIMGYLLHPTNNSLDNELDSELGNKLLFARNDLLYILTIIDDSHLVPNLKEEVSSKNRIINEKDKEIKSLKKELNKLRSEQHQGDTTEISSLEKKNLINSLLKGTGIAIADYLWKMDKEKQIKKNQMVQQLKYILFNVHSPMISGDLQISKDDTINEWLKDTAPDYAKKGGRPRKDDSKDIILYMKK